MKGKLIVCEGLDCSGKTTTINEILNNNKKFIYNKGIGSNTFIGKISRRFPSTLLFFIELIYFVITKIKPNLEKEKIILQDRYDISITSHVPLTNRLYNKLLIKIFKKFIIKPDAIIYFYLPLNEHFRRLKQKGAKYELILANNPILISSKKREYQKWYEQFKGPKIKINTEKNNIKQSTKKVTNFINKLFSKF